MCDLRRAHELKSLRLQPDRPGISRGDSFTVSFVVSPETGLCCLRPRTMRKHRRELISASGYQDRTTSPSASCAFVVCAKSVHRLPRQRFVTIAKRPSWWRERGGTMLLILGRGQSWVPAADWHDGQISLFARNDVNRNLRSKAPQLAASFISHARSVFLGLAPRARWRAVRSCGLARYRDAAMSKHASAVLAVWLARLRDLAGQSTDVQPNAKVQ
jgi:hypothetical protein